MLARLSSFARLSFLLAGPTLSGLLAVGCAGADASATDTEASTDENVGEATEALGAYDHCDQILRGDLFNKVVSNSSSASSSATVFSRYLLSKSLDESYSIYSEAYDEWKKVGGGGGVKILFIDIGGGGGEERKLSKSEYSYFYDRAKRENVETVNYDSRAQSSFVSNYASYVRDPETVRAWASCVTRDAQPGLYAYGSRDAAGNPYVNVVWAPGNFAGVAPNIKVTFVKPTGLEVVGESSATVAVGTGRTFAVRYAQGQNGFDVAVNGTLTDASGRVLGSFTSSARLPPGQMPELGGQPAVGACTSADVRRIHDSYWRAFGRAPDTEEAAGGGEVAGWCRTAAPTFDKLIANHKWFLTQQNANSALVRNTIDRTYRVVFRQPATEGQIQAWVPALLKGDLFTDVTASHGWWAGEHGIKCTTTTWERTTPTSVPLCAP